VGLIKAWCPKCQITTENATIYPWRNETYMGCYDCGYARPVDMFEEEQFEASELINHDDFFYNIEQ
jgi:hypothetical protein